MTKLCFGVGDVFVGLTLLNNLAAYNYLYQVDLFVALKIGIKIRKIIS